MTLATVAVRGGPYIAPLLSVSMDESGARGQRQHRDLPPQAMNVSPVALSLADEGPSPGSGAVSSTTPSYRVASHPDASCEASTIHGLPGTGTLSGAATSLALGRLGALGALGDTLCDTLSALPNRALSGCIETSQDPSTMMLKLLHMSMSEETTNDNNHPRVSGTSSTATAVKRTPPSVAFAIGTSQLDSTQQDNTQVQTLADSTVAQTLDADSASSNDSFTRNSYTVSSQGAGTVSMLSVENEEATLGSVLSERQQTDLAGLSEAGGDGDTDPDAAADAKNSANVQNNLHNLQSALRQLIREVNQQQKQQQQQTGNHSPGAKAAGVSVDDTTAVSAGAVGAAASTTGGPPARPRLTPSLAVLQQQHNNRLIAKKKVLVAAAAMSSRQKQLAMMHRPGPIGGTLRANRVGAGQPIGRTHQFAATGPRSSIAHALAQSVSTNQLPTLYTAHPAKLKGGLELRITIQPEEQHRARYLTEGSRGAVKDRTGNAFPTVKISGTTQGGRLLVFIGSDQGRAVPHMFYQASKVCGKNASPCEELRIDGTTVIQVAIPQQTAAAGQLSASCRELAIDCVGILKERNVDVEKRLARYGNLLPLSALAENATSSKKRSTRCRLVFRVILDSGETLQTSSAPILCTQPPGAPEICKKSLRAAPCDGGTPDTELFIIGKNFLKDTKVVLREVGADGRVTWQSSITPEKEYLQATHLVCRIPPYSHLDISKPVSVEMVITSGGRCSDPSSFVYMPLDGNSCVGLCGATGQSLPSCQIQSTSQLAQQSVTQSSAQQTPQQQQQQQQQQQSQPSEKGTATQLQTANSMLGCPKQENSTASGSAASAATISSAPTILQIPVMPGASTGSVDTVNTVSSAASGSTTTPSPTIQFVVVPAGTGQAQAVLSLLTGGANHQVSAPLQGVVAASESLGRVVAAASPTNNLTFASPESVGSASPCEVTTTPSIAGCALGDNGIKRKISTEDIKPVIDGGMIVGDFVTSPEPESTTIAPVTVQTHTSWASVHSSPPDMQQAVWADTKQPMSATDQAAIQHIATSLAASAQKVEEATEDLHTKKQKVLLQDHPHSDHLSLESPSASSDNVQMSPGPPSSNVVQPMLCQPTAMATEDSPGGQSPGSQQTNIVSEFLAASQQHEQQKQQQQQQQQSQQQQQPAQQDIVPSTPVTFMNSFSSNVTSIGTNFAGTRELLQHVSQVQPSFGNTVASAANGSAEQKSSQQQQQQHFAEAFSTAQNQMTGSPMRTQSQAQQNNGFPNFASTPSSTSSVQSGAAGSSPFQPPPADASSSPHSQFSTSSMQTPPSFPGQQPSGGPPSNGSPPAPGSQPVQQVASVPQPTPSFGDVFSQLAVTNQFTGAGAGGPVTGVSTVTPMDCQSFAPPEIPMNVDSPVTSATACSNGTSPATNGQQQQQQSHSSVFVQSQQQQLQQANVVVQPGPVVSPVNHQMRLASPITNGTMQQSPAGQNFTDHSMNNLQSALTPGGHTASSVTQNGGSPGTIQHHSPGGGTVNTGQLQHGFRPSSAGTLGIPASQKMDMDQFVSPVQVQVSESQAVSNVSLANQLFTTTGIAFPATAGSSQAAPQQAVVNGGQAVIPNGTQSGQPLFNQPLANAGEMQKANGPMITMDTSLSHPAKQANSLQTSNRNAVQKMHQQHVLQQAVPNQAPPQQQVVVTQQMDCQLQSMSMLPESELIRIINPDNFASASIQVQSGVQLSTMTSTLMEATASSPAVNVAARHDQPMQQGGPEQALF